MGCVPEFDHEVTAFIDPMIEWAQPFAEARTDTGFQEVTVDLETGTIVWPGGADLAPDTLYERVRTGAWPDSELAA